MSPCLHITAIGIALESSNKLEDLFLISADVGNNTVPIKITP
jgi:hypothetical protein